MSSMIGQRAHTEALMWWFVRRLVRDLTFGCGHITIKSSGPVHSSWRGSFADAAIAHGVCTVGCTSVLLDLIFPDQRRDLTAL